MARFTVIPKLAPIALQEVDVTDPERVLSVVAQLECSEADVLCDGNYAFSIQQGGKGMWIVSNRNPWQPRHRLDSGGRFPRRSGSGPGRRRRTD